MGRRSKHVDRVVLESLRWRKRELQKRAFAMDGRETAVNRRKPRRLHAEGQRDACALRRRERDESDANRAPLKAAKPERGEHRDRQQEQDARARRNPERAVGRENLVEDREQPERRPERKGDPHDGDRDPDPSAPALLRGSPEGGGGEPDRDEPWKERLARFREKSVEPGEAGNVVDTRSFELRSGLERPHHSRAQLVPVRKSEGKGYERARRRGEAEARERSEPEAGLDRWKLEKHEHRDDGRAVDAVVDARAEGQRNGRGKSDKGPEPGTALENPAREVERKGDAERGRRSRILRAK